jgi:hypothetical protein
LSSSRRLKIAILIPVSIRWIRPNSIDALVGERRQDLQAVPQVQRDVPDPDRLIHRATFTKREKRF